MTHKIMLIGCLCAIASGAIASAAIADTRVGRPMIIHQLPELQLEIWTEQDPEWETHMSETTLSATFVAETPALTYPPAQMSWTTAPALQFAEEDFEAAARGALNQVAANYGATLSKMVQRRQYGALVGYETSFPAKSQNVPVDVLAFCGHQPGRPAVVMHVVTLRDKLPHLSEHIRRSWTHVRYLD